MKENNFQPKKYQFENGVVLDINEQKIILTINNDKKTLNAENIDNFAQQEHIEPTMSRGTLLFWIIGISFGMVALSEIYLGGWSFFSWSLTFILIAINIVIFLIFMIDELLELGIFRRIIQHYFSNEGILFTIGNNSGNNLDIIVYKEEHSKVLDLEKTIEELRIFKKETSQINNVVSTTNLDELKKLGELLESNIITKEEFETKKSELLK